VRRLKAELEARLSRPAARRSGGTGAAGPQKQECRPPYETATWLLLSDRTITGITEDEAFTVVYSATTGGTLSSVRRLKSPGSQDLRGDRRSAHTAPSAGSPARYPHSRRAASARASMHPPSTGPRSAVPNGAAGRRRRIRGWLQPPRLHHENCNGNECLASVRPFFSGHRGRGRGPSMPAHAEPSPTAGHPDAAEQPP
jgi:hypothetical protein